MNINCIPCGDYLMQNASGIAVFSMDPRNGQRLRINSPSPMPRAVRASEMGI